MRDENCRVLIQIRFSASLPITYRELTEDFPKILKFLFVVRVIFHQVSENFPTPSRWLYNRALINQLWGPYGKIFGPWFFVRTSFHSVHTSKLRSEYFAVWTSQLVNKSILLYGYSSWPQCFLANWLGWPSAGQRHPAQWIHLLNKTANALDQNCLKILGKLRKVIKLGKMLFIRFVSDYFSEILG